MSNRRDHGAHLGHATWLLGASLLGVSACLPVSVHAGWFEREDRSAVEYFERGDFAGAAQRFEDSYRRGVALYRTGRSVPRRFPVPS